MSWETDLLGLLAALAISVLTAPTGVSGAVFLLPLHLSVFQVPNPSVTPTNLLYNVVSGPGALLRYSRRASLRSRLVSRLVLGTLPGVLVGSVVRVYVIADPDAFRLCAAAVLLPLGVWLALSSGRAAGTAPLSDRTITTLAVVVGFIGGVYGIGGGSLLGPLLVGTGMSVTLVAPATLMSTFVTSVAGAASYVALAQVAGADVAPDWSLGIACGVGGLIGGYLGASAQPYLPERGLRRLLGTLAVAVAVVYAVQALA